MFTRLMFQAGRYLRQCGLANPNASAEAQHTRKLGLLVDCSKGNGSHCLIIRASTRERYTLQKSLYKVVNEKIFRQMLRWGFIEDRIDAALQ